MVVFQYKMLLCFQAVGDKAMLPYPEDCPADRTLTPSIRFQDRKCNI
jgi:hypothetical protein